MPSEVYGCLAAGRPILFVGADDGEIAQLIRKNDCGWVVAPDDPEGLVRAITTLARTPDRVAEMGHNARHAFDQELDLRHAQRRWRALIHDLQTQSRTAPVDEAPPGTNASAPPVNLGEPSTRG